MVELMRLGIEVRVTPSLDGLADAIAYGQTITSSRNKQEQGPEKAHIDC